MACNCHVTVKEKLAAYYAEKLPPGSTDIEVSLKGIKYAMSDIQQDPIARSANDVEIYYKQPKKSGGMKPTKTKTYLVAQFCPFCGTRYLPQEPQS